MFGSKRRKATAAAARNATAARRGSEGVAALVLADLAVRGGRVLLDRAARHGARGAVLKDTLDKAGAGQIGAGKVVRAGSLGQTVAATVLANVARRSVPGAIVVGGALLAKTLHDRRKEARAQAAARAAGNRAAALDPDTPDPGADPAA